MIEKVLKKKKKRRIKVSYNKKIKKILIQELIHDNDDKLSINPYCGCHFLKGGGGGVGLKPKQGSLIRLPKIIMKRKLREEFNRQRLN